MIIQGLTLDGGFQLDPPATPTPTGPSKFVVGAWADDDAGSKSGSAYVYNTDGTGELKITASDAAGGDRFGISAARSDTRLAVGAMGVNSYRGAVYVYNTDGTGEQKIVASDGAASDLFGWSSTISDTHVVAGAIQSNGMAGSVYVYNLDGTGEQKITASDGAANDYFGHSVAISDTKVIVGAQYKNNNTGAVSINSAGAVYVYNLDGTGELKILASDGAHNDHFGSSVAIHGDKIIVGAVHADYNQYEQSRGAVYVYNLDGTGEVKITASDRNLGDGFGISVAVSDNHIVVGAPEDDDSGSNSGSVYVYNLDGTGEVKITASDGAANDYFGGSVAIHGDKIIVGAYADDDAGNMSGSVYVYNTDGTGEQKIVASDATGDEYLGFSVATN